MTVACLRAPWARGSWRTRMIRRRGSPSRWRLCSSCCRRWPAPTRSTTACGASPCSCSARCARARTPPIRRRVWPADMRAVIRTRLSRGRIRPADPGRVRRQLRRQHSDRATQTRHLARRVARAGHRRGAGRARRWGCCCGPGGACPAARPAGTSSARSRGGRRVPSLPRRVRAVSRATSCRRSWGSSWWPPRRRLRCCRSRAASAPELHCV